MSNEESLEQLALVALALKMKADKAKKDYETAQANFEEALQRAGKYDENTHVVGHVKTTLTPNRYFDAEEAATELAPAELEECYIKVLDKDLLKQHLTPIQYQRHMKFHAKKYKLGLSVLDD